MKSGTQPVRVPPMDDLFHRDPPRCPIHHGPLPCMHCKMGVKRKLEGDPGGAARDEGIARAHKHSPEDWKARAHVAVREVCLKMEQFTSDNIWAVLDRPREPRALAGILRSHNGKSCEPTSVFIPTKQVSRHRAPVRVWRSLIFQG